MKEDPIRGLQQGGKVHGRLIVLAQKGRLRKARRGNWRKEIKTP